MSIQLLNTLRNKIKNFDNDNYQNLLCNNLEKISKFYLISFVKTALNTNNIELFEYTFKLIIFKKLFNKELSDAKAIYKIIFSRIDEFPNDFNNKIYDIVKNQPICFIDHLKVLKKNKKVFDEQITFLKVNFLTISQCIKEFLKETERDTLLYNYFLKIIKDKMIDSKDIKAEILSNVFDFSFEYNYSDDKKNFCKENYLTILNIDYIPKLYDLNIDFSIYKRRTIFSFIFDKLFNRNYNLNQTNSENYDKILKFIFQNIKVKYDIDMIDDLLLIEHIKTIESNALMKALTIFFKNFDILQTYYKSANIDKRIIELIFNFIGFRFDMKVYSSIGLNFEKDLTLLPENIFELIQYYYLYSKDTSNIFDYFDDITIKKLDEKLNMIYKYCSDVNEAIDLYCKKQIRKFISTLVIHGNKINNNMKNILLKYPIFTADELYNIENVAKTIYKSQKLRRNKVIFIGNKEINESIHDKDEENKEINESFHDKDSYKIDRRTKMISNIIIDKHNVII